MSAVNRVIDYMGGLPQAHQHRELYHTQFMEQYNNSAVQLVDGVEVEFGLISDGEKEILAHLNIQEKFTRHALWEGFDLASMVSFGKDRKVKRERKNHLDFKCVSPWSLFPSSARALYSAKGSTLNLMDDEQRRMILSKCPTMSGTDASSVYMASIHERLSTPTDLRHLFTKMYLYLQDYTLAVVSRGSQISQAENMAFQLMPFADEGARFAAVATNHIVIDGDLFTPEQLSLLCLSAEEYPSVWYAGEENIYNSCSMEADDMVIISNGPVVVDTSFLWGSPDRMYHTMWMIAQKLNAVGCLAYAIENMRGKCKMMADIVEKTECREVNAMIPKSYCMTTSFGQWRDKQVITKMPGYCSTSISLIADLLYGMSFKAIASCVAETLGAMGKVVSSSTPFTNETINSIMRDYGLQHTESESNHMLQNFEMFTRKPTRWDVGQYMKDYALQLSEDVMMGIDIPLPSILLTVPALTAIHTAFGLARGWYGDAPDILKQTKEDRLHNTDALCAAGWLSGLRNCRPQVFRNRLGRKQIMVSPEERRLKAEAQDDCRIRDVEFWLTDDLGGRVDESEESGSNLFRTEFAGTKCAMVFSYDMGRWVEAAKQDYSRLKRETQKGDLTQRERDTMSKVVPTQVNWGPAPNRAGELNAGLEYMRTLSRGSAIIPSVKARYVRVGSDQRAVVPTFVEDGVEREEFESYSKPVIREGQSLKFTEIDVPGDGQCGIHAIVKDLVVNGRLAEGDAASASKIFTDGMASASFHDANEMAAQCQKWDMGMDLIDVGSKSVIRYGREDAEYRTTIIRDGLHFKTGRIRPDGPHEIVVERLEEQTLVPEEFIARVEGYGMLFGGSPHLS